MSTFLDYGSHQLNVLINCFNFPHSCVLLTGNPEDTAARATASEKDGDIKRVSTKDWARSTGYDPVKLFNKVTEERPNSVKML